ncbi:hypothetical protein B0H13DRAFT_2534020 [Mycena leptocephala]|nr:hypothetical protein B0H13DRAFT_2534020 [Mycena leptocephala]
MPASVSVACLSARLCPAQRLRTNAVRIRIPTSFSRNPPNLRLQTSSNLEPSNSGYPSCLSSRPMLSDPISLIRILVLVFAVNVHNDTLLGNQALHVDNPLNKTLFCYDELGPLEIVVASASATILKFWFIDIPQGHVNAAATIRISTPTAAHEGGRTQIKFESAAADILCIEHGTPGKIVLRTSALVHACKEKKFKGLSGKKATSWMSESAHTCVRVGDDRSWRRAYEREDQEPEDKVQLNIP